MTHAKKAREYFLKGYNCAQSVCAAFCDVTGIPESEALKLSSSFGGGFGRLREICGAVSATGIVLGLICGYDRPDDPAQKSEHYARIQALAKEFEAQNGSLLCRELLAGLKADTSPDATPRDAQYYRERPCLRFVESAADLLDEALKKERL